MAKAIMVQGTTSGAGKSLVAAALCRIFHQDGYRVAPFKAQNIALNSFITKDGLEMGRAQVVQAEAACIEPDVRMNPLLLKPNQHMGSQVVLEGKVFGNLKASEFKVAKEQFVPRIMAAYESLASEYDIIVLEGAGGPAEINLNKNDIVNMGMAMRAKAPVLLVGDIERGGVFASLVGTLNLLVPEQRAYVKATIINKFRGNPAYFADGPALLEAHTGIPNAGVIPYMDVDVEEEDSLGLDSSATAGPTALELAVIRLPHISNFTDFQVFERMPNVCVRYVSRARELGTPDIVFLPGTKNTLDDLLWLRQSGLEGAIQRLCEKQVPVIGICGGYQMLGKSLEDPHGVEAGGMARGIGLLPLRTVFEKEKTTLQTRGVFEQNLSGVFAPLSGLVMEGYEIHMGKTTQTGQSLVCLEPGNRPDGCINGNVAGSYVHGLFDAPGVAEALLAPLFAQKGLASEQNRLSQAEYKNSQYDLLAHHVRQSLDLALIYRILQQGV